MKRTAPGPARSSIASPLLIIFLSLYGFYSFSCQRVADPDLLGHLAFGRYILEHRAIPRFDLFSYLPTRPLWVNHEWVSEVIFYFFLRTCGEGGLLLFKTLLGIAMILLCFLTARRLGGGVLHHLMIFGLAMKEIGPMFYIRPYIFTYFFFALFLYLLQEARTEKRWPCYVIVASTALWANCHAGFVSGICLVAIYALMALIGKTPQWPRYFLLLFACVLAVLVNPYGIVYFGYIWDAITMSRSYIVEWLPVPLEMKHFLSYKILLLVAAFSLITSRMRRNPTDVLILFSTALVSWSSYRHVPFFVLASCVLVPAYLQSALLRACERINLRVVQEEVNAVVLAMANGAAVLLLWVAFHIGPAWSILVPESRSVLSGHEFPVQAVYFMARKGINGNIACFFNWGEYLIWTLGKESKVSFDGRLETVYPDEIIQLNLDFTWGIPGRWRRLLEDYPTEIVLISKRNPVYDLMKKERGWNHIYDDPEAAIFLKDIPKFRRILW